MPLLTVLAAEVMASAIFHKHAKAFTGGAYDPDHSGAEWWLQGIHCRNTPGMQWHVDVDRRCPCSCASSCQSS